MVKLNQTLLRWSLSGNTLSNLYPIFEAENFYKPNLEKVST